MGQLFTIWTIRFALAFYVSALAIWIRCARRRRSCVFARWTWTLGCVFYLIHVFCAFHFYHHWSHGAAYQETAKEVEAVFGFSWGGGLYLNYAFTLAWLGDAAWTWLNFEGYLQRPRWVTATLHSFMVFMVFNATVVFETGLFRWIGVAAVAGLAVLRWREWQTGERGGDVGSGD